LEKFANNNFAKKTGLGKTTKILNLHFAKKQNPLKIMFWYEIHNFVLVCSRKSGNEANM
jgi:hypothetical protein